MFRSLAPILSKLSPGLRKILGNVGWLFVERILSIILTFFVGVWVIRYLGADNFGKLSYSLSVIALFSAIPQLGLSEIVTRNLVQSEKATHQILGTAFLLKLIASVLFIVLLDGVIWTIYRNSELRWLMFLLSISVFFNIFDTIDFWFQSQVLSGKLAIIRGLQIMFSSLTKIVLINLKAPLIAFAGLVLAEAIFKSIGTIIIYMGYKQSPRKWQFNKDLALEMLKDSWPLVFAGIMVSVYVKIDQVMLGNMTNAQEVGNYAAAVRFSEVFYFIPGIVCTSVFPAILRAKQADPIIYHNRLQQLYDMMGWLSLMIAVPMTIIGVPLLQLLLGSEYNESGKILTWHIWASPFVFLGVARSQWLIAENYARFSFLTTSLGTIVNIGLNFWLIPIYGGQGAAIATVISYAVASHLSCWFYPPMYSTGWMLTKALFIPFRFRQNMIYLNSLKMRCL